MEETLQEILTEIEKLKKLIIALTRKIENMERDIDTIKHDVHHLD